MHSLGLSEIRVGDDCLGLILSLAGLDPDAESPESVVEMWSRPGRGEVHPGSGVYLANPQPPNPEPAPRGSDPGSGQVRPQDRHHRRDPQ